MWRLNILRLTVAALFLTISSGLAAGGVPGDLDTSFGTNGKVVTLISNGDDIARGVAVQSDGKIVAAGYAAGASGGFALARYNTDGTLDSSFGSGGKVVTSFRGNNDAALAVAIQPDGKIVAAGYTPGLPDDFALARYNTDGTLDQTFGANGKIITPVGTDNSMAFAIALQSDGKIVVAGHSANGPNGSRDDFALVRYNTDGTLDNSFGSGGKVITPVGSSFDDAYAVAIQPDGKIVAAGTAFRDSNIFAQDLVLVRYNVNGSLDTNFGTNGKVTTTAGNGEEYLFAIAIQPDGKIIAGGYSDGATAANLVLIRLTSDGTPDASFGSGGKVITPNNSVARSIVIQPDGKIVTAGESYNGSVYLFSLSRFNSGGALDSSFGAGGTVLTSIGNANAAPSAVALQPDGKIVAAGYSFNGSNKDFALIRYLGDDLSNGTPPSISINDISIVEGNSGQKTAVFTVSLSTPTPNQVTVHYSTAEGTATANEDYLGGFGTILFGPNLSSKTIFVTINGDTFYEPDETFFVNLSIPTNAVISKGQGVGTILNDDVPNMQFTMNSYAVNEGDGSAVVVVTRGGDLSLAATVNYATSDGAGLHACNELFNGIASSRCDYATTVGTVRFGAGESSKTIFIPIVDDGYVDGMESFTIKLSEPTGTILGSNSTATVNVFDNDSSPSNPIVGVPFFVRQQYIDFLGREPDAGGYQAWQNILNSCAAGDSSCDRIAVSSGFFRSPEFQDRGYFIFRFYSAALGRNPLYSEFMPDLAKVSGFLTDAQLEANKVAFVQEFMTRVEFTNKYGSLSNAAFVDTLVQTAGLQSHPLRDAWVSLLNSSGATRAEVLRAFTESLEVYNKFYNQAFVVMQYFGYLRRDPDASYLAWIQILNSNGGDYRGMISGFMNSNEYVLRFGP